MVFGYGRCFCIGFPEKRLKLAACLAGWPAPRKVSSPPSECQTSRRQRSRSWRAPETWLQVQLRERVGAGVAHRPQLIAQSESPRTTGASANDTARPLKIREGHEGGITIVLPRRPPQSAGSGPKPAPAQRPCQLVHSTLPAMYKLWRSTSLAR